MCPCLRSTLPAFSVSAGRRDPSFGSRSGALTARDQARSPHTRAVSSTRLRCRISSGSSTSLGESANLAVRTGDATRSIASVECRQALRVGSRAVPVEPGKIEEYVLRLYPFAATFNPGHRLVVELSNDEPLADAHNALLPPDAFHLPVGRPVTHKIYRDAAHPSRLVLPFTARTAVEKS